MEKTGKALGRVYLDEDAIVYIDWLFVKEEERRNGLGTRLQEIREQIGKLKGAIAVCLWVKKESWMYD